MKKYVMLLLAFFIANLLSAQAPPNLTKEQKSQMIDMAVEFFGKPTPSKTPVPDVISDKNLPKNISPQDFEKQLTLFTNSLYFNVSDFHEDEVRLEADVFLLPNSGLIKPKFTWKKAVAKEGGNLEILPKNDGFQASSLDFFNESVNFKPQTGKTLASIEGTFSANYPTEFKQISFVKSDIGKEQIIEGITIKLISMENDLAFFQISGKSDLVYFAQNAKGESLFLETLQAEIPKVVYDAIGKDGKLSAKKKQEFLDKFDTMPNENQPMMSYIKALGSVSQLIVVKPMKFVSKEVPVKVLKTPDFKAKNFTVNRERYENLPANFHYDKITDADLANLSVKARRSNDGLNNHVVLVSVPNSLNSASARVEFKDVLTKKGGKNVEFEGQGAFYEEKEKNFSYRLEPKSGDKPIEVDEIKGIISITFPAEITTMNLPANKKSEDFELISPSRVRFFRKESDLDNSSSVKPIRAYAANGMALKRVEGISSSGSENSKSYVEYMFWGKVAAVQVDVATKWLTKEIPFSVKPAAKTEKKF